LEKKKKKKKKKKRGGGGEGRPPDTNTNKTTPPPPPGGGGRVTYLVHMHPRRPDPLVLLALDHFPQALLIPGLRFRGFLKYFGLGRDSVLRLDPLLALLAALGLAHLVLDPMEPLGLGVGPR
jgi:hypothetical protein